MAEPVVLSYDYLKPKPTTIAWTVKSVTADHALFHITPLLAMIGEYATEHQPRNPEIHLLSRSERKELPYSMFRAFVNTNGGIRYDVQHADVCIHDRVGPGAADDDGVVRIRAGRHVIFISMDYERTLDYPLKVDRKLYVLDPLLFASGIQPRTRSVPSDDVWRKPPKSKTLALAPVHDYRMPFQEHVRCERRWS